jgi:hypothetical protein
MLSAARKGPYKNMIWAWDQGSKPYDTDDPYGGHRIAIINIYCYSRADSSGEDDVLACQEISTNMHDQVESILQDYLSSLTGALETEIPLAQPKPLDDPNAKPPFGCKIIQVEVTSIVE